MQKVTGVASELETKKIISNFQTVAKVQTYFVLYRMSKASNLKKYAIVNLPSVAVELFSLPPSALSVATTTLNILE